MNTEIPEENQDTPPDVPAPDSRLVAILFADVAGYSRMMSEDEDGTYRAIGARLDTFNRLLPEHGGRLMQTRGDGVFAMFESVINAVNFAVAAQKRLKVENADLDQGRRIEFRIGIHVGDVRVRDGHHYGDSINIASRIEGQGKPGGVCISDNVYQLVRNRVEFGFEFAGNRALKNIPIPVGIYHIVEERSGAIMAASQRVLPTQSGTKSKPERPSVAILPFRNLTGRGDEEYLSDGITEDITTNLSRFQDMFVISRNSAFTYKNRPTPLRQVGEELGVRYIAEGSLRQAGKKMRISVDLVDAPRDHTVWSERYDFNFEEIFDVQDEICSTIAGAAAIQVRAAEHEKLKELAPADLEAYRLVLKGQQFIVRYTRDDNQEARHLYETALKNDPDYARALASLSRTVNIDWRYSWTDSSQAALEKALKLARAAVELNETDARGFAELGFAYLYLKEHTSAVNAYERAVRLNPNDADIISDMADALAHSGRSEEAIGLLERAMRLNPYYPDQYLWHLGGAYFNLKRYDEAVQTLLRMNNPTEGRRLLAASYAQMGYMVDARREANMVREAHPEFSLERWASVQPDKNPEDVEHFVDGLKKAGL